MLMWGKGKLQLSLVHLHVLLPFPPVLLSWLPDGPATVRILNERPFLPSQSVSHPGKGDLGGGEAARLQALIPGCYDRASGWEIWRSSSTGLFPLSWHPLGCISHISNTRCIHTVSKKVRVLFSQILYTLVMKKNQHFVCETCNVSSFWAHGLGYLCWVHVVEHHYGCAVVVQHQPPKVLHCVWQRVLGHYERRRLLVTLEEQKQRRKSEISKNDTAVSLKLRSPDCWWSAGAP